MNKTKTWFFEDISKIGKPVARLAKKKEKKAQNTISEIKKEIISDPGDIKKIIKEYYKLCIHKFDNLS